MGRGMYDREDISIARQLYADLKCKSVAWVVERLREQDPQRYKSLNDNTLYKWKKNDAGTEFDWDARRLEYRRKVRGRSDQAAEFQAESVLNRTLDDMLKIQAQLSALLTSLIGDGSADAPGEQKKPVQKIDLDQLNSMLRAYNSSVDKALSILRSKIQQVDLSRLTPENRGFFIRRVLEELIACADSLDRSLAAALERNLDPLVARLGQDMGLTDLSDDLCIQTIMQRYEVLNARDHRPTTAYAPRADRVACE